MLPVGLRILIVDDDEDDCYIFNEAVEAMNEDHVVFRACDCNELFGLLKRESIDIIFLDIRMPLRDGKQCLKEIKATVHLAHIPVIMFSTSQHDRDIDETYEAGAQHYIIKPADYIAIINSVTKVLRLEWEKLTTQPLRDRFVIAAAN